MKKILIILTATLLFSEIFAAVTPPSTQGSNFYFSFMRGRNDREKTMTLLVSSPQNATIRLTNPRTGNTKDYNITANVVGTINLLYIASGGSNENTGTGSFTASNTVAYPHPDCYSVTVNQVLDMGYYIEAFAPGDPTTPVKVSIYASMAADLSFDVANVLPIEALGNEYYVISRDGNNPDSWKSEAVIVATEDNTVIQISPTSIIEGQSASDDIFSTYEITLMRGQTYLVRAQSSNRSDKGRNDLTGTLIKVKDDGGANKCKKIAVFSGTQHGSGENVARTNGDYEYEQLFPTHLWGNNFMVVSTLKGTGNQELPDVVRVVASQPCTEIKINGVYITTINQSEYYEFKLTTPAEGAFVNTSKPVEVALFPTREKGDNQGAPNMITVAPIEQYLNNITFSAAPGDGVNKHQVLITSLASICEQTTLNGVLMNPANGYTWTPIAANPDYATIITSINTGISYTLINNANPTKGGVTAYIYGDGTKIGYGYSVGSAARSAETQFYLNDDPSLNSGNLAGVCVDKPVDFIANVNVSYSSIEWDFGDGTPRVTINNPETRVSHAYASTGTYSVQMIVFKTFSECYGNIGLQDTAIASIQIIDRIESVRTETLCKGQSIMSNRTSNPVFGGLTPKYFWSTGATTESITLTDDHGTTNKKYWVKTYDANCHLFVDTITVNIRPIEQTSRAENHCNNLSNISASETIGFTSLTPNTNGNPVTYLWNTGQTTQTIPVTDAFGTITKHWVSATAGCMYVDTIIVTVPAKVDNAIAASHDRVCGDGGTLVSVNATNNCPTCTNIWEISENGAGFIGLSPSVNPNLHQYNAINSSEFRYTSTGTCETIVKNTTVLANTPFTAELIPTSADFIGGTLLPLSGGTVTLEVVTDVPNSYIYNWTPNVTATNTFTKAITQDESYQVFVSDLQGKCTSTTNLVELKLGSVTINTIINPTGSANRTIAEGLTDTFTYGYKTIVYNRYNQLVSEKENAGWDGLYKGKPADAGVYFYILEYKLSDGSTKAIKGSVEVIK